MGAQVVLPLTLCVLLELPVAAGDESWGEATSSPSLSTLRKRATACVALRTFWQICQIFVFTKKKKNILGHKYASCILVAESE